MKIFNAESDTVTSSLGAALATTIKNRGSTRVFVALKGDLGAGKTVFTRGFVGIMSPGSRVKSPTYTIVNEYLRGEVPVYHFDFYRIDDPSELDGIGFDDYLDSGICIAEWCENIDGYVPKDAIHVEILKAGENSRVIKTDFEFDLEV